MEKPKRPLAAIALLILATLATSCSKVGPETSGSDPAPLTFRNLASISEIQQYHDAIILGTLDLLDDSLFVHSAINIALSTETLSEQSDYYAHYQEVATVFSNHNRNLLAEMIHSASNHSTNPVFPAALQSYGLSYPFSYYVLRPRLFLIHLDTQAYYNPTQMARLTFSDLDMGLIPVWTQVNDSKGFTQETANVSVLEDNPVWTVSSSIVDTRNAAQVDAVAFEAGGKKKCKKSSATGWCVNSGKKCKCHYGDPIDEKIANLDLVNAFLSGTLEPEYYIGN